MKIAAAGVAWLSAVVALGGCGSGVEPTRSVVTSLGGDARYEITLEATPPDRPEAEGTFLVRVDTRGDWHVADEAPAWLRIDETSGLEMDGGKRVPASATDRRIDFDFPFSATIDGPAFARGELKFGVCEGDDDACSIVKEEIELPVTIAFGDAL